MRVGEEAAANVPSVIEQVNHAHVIGAMLSPRIPPSSWTSEAQIQDPLPHGG
ncbi:hypothetical protein ACVWXO_002061 [Bradyrhizobium sp. LM2.7]